MSELRAQLEAEIAAEDAQAKFRKNVQAEKARLRAYRKLTFWQKAAEWLAARFR